MSLQRPCTLHFPANAVNVIQVAQMWLHHHDYAIQYVGKVLSRAAYSALSPRLQQKYAFCALCVPGMCLGGTRAGCWNIQRWGLVVIHVAKPPAGWVH